jgi:hypothetical protein
MNKSILSVVVAAAILATIHASSAGEVTGLVSFTANTPAVAAQVNGNFTAVKTAVDNNHARITTLESGAASPSISGNLTLVPSTATTGNIMKGGTRFLHDYGEGNTFLGENAGNFSMTGSNNTASGMNALYSNTEGYSNTASGSSALYSNTTGVANTASGSSALQSNTTGYYNTASGVQALYSNTTGHENTASGTSALQGNTTGYSNTASGSSALRSNTTGRNNTASGTSALQSNTTGYYNTASGFYALYSNTEGYYNTASGTGALRNNTTGNDNTAIGYLAGFDLTTGSNNIAIDNRGVAGESNTIRIGETQTRAFIAGIRGVTTATAAVPVLIGTDGQLGTASSSRRVKDDIADMGTASKVLMQLRPVTFHYKSDKNPKGRSPQYGLIAEEVEKVAPGLVARSATGEIETVYYQHLTPMLLNEYQKQQRMIETQAAVLKKQTAHIAALELDRRTQTARLATLEQEMARMTAVLVRLQQIDRIAAAKMDSQ